MEYKHIQTTAALRNRNGIKAYRIFGIEENNLLANYGKYGVTRAELEPIIDDGIQNYDLSLEATYSG